MAPPCLSDVCVSQTNILLAWCRLVLWVAAMPRCGDRLYRFPAARSSRRKRNPKVSSTGWRTTQGPNSSRRHPGFARRPRRQDAAALVGLEAGATLELPHEVLADEVRAERLLD